MFDEGSGDTRSQRGGLCVLVTSEEGPQTSILLCYTHVHVTPGRRVLAPKTEVLVGETEWAEDVLLLLSPGPC